MQPKVLDMCCGTRMFWFDKNDPRATYMDKRKETIQIKVKTYTYKYDVAPNTVADFRNLPYPDNHFKMIIFDPPHLIRNKSSKSVIQKRYGQLSKETWKADITKGFSEAFRVLCPGGTLIFKWNECSISIKEILSCTYEKPLVGSKHGKHQNSHFIVFMKSV
jgi:ubiquinone/menaquinone biosynthesis C-methylase UbiE